MSTLGGGTLPLRSPSYLTSLDPNQLLPRNDSACMKSLVIGVNTFMRKPDSYNNRFPW